MKPEIPANQRIPTDTSTNCLDHFPCHGQLCATLIPRIQPRLESGGFWVLGSRPLSVWIRAFVGAIVARLATRDQHPKNVYEVTPLRTIVFQVDINFSSFIDHPACNGGGSQQVQTMALKGEFNERTIGPRIFIDLQPRVSLSVRLLSYKGNGLYLRAAGCADRYPHPLLRFHLHPSQPSAAPYFFLLLDSLAQAVIHHAQPTF